MAKKIGIIGGGNVGGALNRGLTKAGYETRVSDKTNIAEVAGEADVVILAVPFGAIDDVVSKLASIVNGKIVVDVTNALTPQMQLAPVPSSGAEELQKKLQGAKVVKAFNTVFATHMETGKVNGTTLTAFVAGDDEQARNTVLELAKAIGFDAVNAGSLSNARQLEAIGFLNIQLGYVLGNGPETGFKYIR